MPIRKDVGATDMAVNASFLIDALNLIEGDVAHLQLNTEKKPFLIQGEVTDIGAPGGAAFAATLRGETFSGLESLEKSVGKIKPVELPEIVLIAKELTGKYPTVTKRFKSSLGKSYLPLAGSEARIKLADKIFSDPALAEKVLAHEIGHIADWMPTGTIKRGNLVGRIATLNSHLKDAFGDLSNKELRKELMDLRREDAPGYDDLRDLASAQVDKNPSMYEDVKIS